MPELSRKQLEFFAMLILICTVTAGVILLIDFQIKGAILEESNRLRRIIESHTAGANGSRFASDSHVNPGYPSDLVSSGDALMEEAGYLQGSNGQAEQVGQRTVEPNSTDGSTDLQD